MSGLDFSDFISAAESSIFEETPVSVEEFVQSEEYLNLPHLSDAQYDCIKRSTQIYNKDTLNLFLKPKEAQKRWDETFSEVILQLGKGSGKDFMSTISCAYVVYLLLCLKDPQKYYNKPPGDAIDIINVATNSDQASRVFFKGFVQRIKKSPWFQGKYDAKSNGDPATNGEVHFNKEINVYSGHSEREGFEGYNTIFVFLDEIAGFAVAGGSVKNTADEVYKMYSASITSRFPNQGKLILASFPRYKGDFITKRYDEVIATKTDIQKSETVKLNDDLPDGIQNNELEIAWIEHKIHAYSEPGVYALRLPSWRVNPTKKLDDYKRDFKRDPQDAYGRYACMPPDSISGLFRSREALEAVFNRGYKVDDTTVRMSKDFIPDPSKEYFVHVDLAEKHDLCVIAMAHVENWVKIPIGRDTYDIQPMVIIDLIKYWEPETTGIVDFNEVKSYVFSIKNAGFNIRKITFDRWNSTTMIKAMNEAGIGSELLSVATIHYDELMMFIADNRLAGPRLPRLVDDMLHLQLIKGKVDHPSTGYGKDLSDAVCGALWNAAKLTDRDQDQEVQIMDYQQVSDALREELRTASRPGKVIDNKPVKKYDPEDDFWDDAILDDISLI